MQPAGKSSADGLVECWARRIARWRLVTPAIILLEANKPLSFVGSQALLLLGPFVDFFGPAGWLTDACALLADRDRYEGLIVQLESLQGARPEGGDL
jgi:hypothetical protein